ncbi:pseudaminic acid synthase [Vibrio profundi]|uniref:pseudaminic acid synthase n=1 Tax=Vibrio profundi TaxID=1774960 RepID=UPI003734D493
MKPWLLNKTYIIAELSANHNNDLERAKQTIVAMAQAGADAVKVQTYRPESLCLNIDNEYFGERKAGLWKGQRLWDIYKGASLPYEWHKPLQEVAEQHNLDFFSSPFDLEGVDFLETLNVPYYKIASFEITHIPLIEKVAKTGKPIIISTGVADDDDIQLALNTCRNAGNENVALLKCTSQYPATIEQANLSMIPEMRARFSVPIGLSDHTMGSLVPTVAVSLGAQIVEKHFILDRNDGGADSAFSMEPHEFSQMVTNIRQAEASLGGINYQVSDSDKLRRRSIFFTTDIPKGTTITTQHIRVLRNGSGAHPKIYDDLIGKTLTADVDIGQPVKPELFQDS